MDLEILRERLEWLANAQPGEAAPKWLPSNDWAGAIKDVAAAALDELDTWIDSFELRHAADMRAIKRWREEAPGRELTLPDHADLVVWLLKTLDTLNWDRIVFDPSLQAIKTDQHTRIMADWQPIAAAPIPAPETVNTVLWSFRCLIQDSRGYVCGGRARYTMLRSKPTLRWYSDSTGLIGDPCYFMPMPAPQKEKA